MIKHTLSSHSYIPKVYEHKQQSSAVTKKAWHKPTITTFDLQTKTETGGLVPRESDAGLYS